MEDSARVDVIANQLEGLNAQRKQLCDQVTRAAIAQLEDDPSLLNQPIRLANSSIKMPQPIYLN